MCWIGRWPDYAHRQHEYFSDSGGDVKRFIWVALIICNLLLEFQKSSVFEALIITYAHLSWLYFSCICILQTVHDCFLSTLLLTYLHFQHGWHGNLWFSNVTVVLKMRVEVLYDYTSQKTAISIATSLRTLLCHCTNCLGIFVWERVCSHCSSF